MALNSNVHSDQEKNPIMAVRPLLLAVTEEIPSRRNGKARSSQTKHNCFICDKPVDINASNAAASKAMHEMVSRYDYSSFGGAPLLGIDGICIICHGSSGDRAIRNAIGVAAEYARVRLNEKIVLELAVQPTVPDDE